MSSEKKRQHRIQGGWNAAPSTRTVDRTTQANHPCQPEGLAYSYKQPSEIKMPSEVPPHFSWVVQGLLAGCGIPRQVSHLQYLLDSGITNLVSLTGNDPPVKHCPGIKHFKMFVPEFEPPSIKQAEDFVAIVEKANENKEAVAVHCHWGIGRTGTMLACYLVKGKNLTADEAIDEVRILRPYSIETLEQERLVHLYFNHLHQSVKLESR